MFYRYDKRVMFLFIFKRYLLDAYKKKTAERYLDI
jgi:hypothetical protein